MEDDRQPLSCGQFKECHLDPLLLFLPKDPEDAYRCFMRTHIDYLALGPFLLDKKNQPAWKETGDWRQEFQLD